jgi:tetratricopeptide (TPR) repeat protein
VSAAEALANKYPKDDALQVNAANAEMIAAEKGMPGSAAADDPHLAKAQARLETVLNRNSEYTPAIHFYLHLTEWQGRPAASLNYANKLAALAPEAGHMLHMSSHIDYHTGNYEAAARANMSTVSADMSYVERMQPPGGMEAIPMHQHNLLYGLVAALISGDKDLGLKFANEMQRSSPPESLAFAESYFALGRLLPADDVPLLKAPDFPLANAFYHFALGEAMIRRGDSVAAAREVVAIQSVETTGSFGKIDPKIVAMVTVAREMLEGRVAMLRKDYAQAVKSYAAVFEEERDGYCDPPIWPWPPRRSLAEALLLQRHMGEARKEIEATLQALPDDPVSLHVLAEITAQLHDPESARIMEHAVKAWCGSSDLLKPEMI